MPSPRPASAPAAPAGLAPAAKALLAAPAPAPALSLLEATHSAVRLGAGVARGSGGGLGSLKGAVDVGREAYAELLDSFAAGSKRAPARALFADAGAQAAAAPRRGAALCARRRRLFPPRGGCFPRRAQPARGRGLCGALPRHRGGAQLASAHPAGFRAPLRLCFNLRA
jgi:hypothetical protein